MKFRKLFILIFLANTSIAQAQLTRENSKNFNSWWMYFGNHKFSSQWGLHAEVQVRRYNGVQEPMQLLLRTGLDYYANQVRYTLGYGYINTYPYGEYPVVKTFPEHRMWQQAQVGQGVGKVKLIHRFRVEQRWLGNSLTGEFENGRYENRFRYMLRVNIPFQGSIEPGKFYGSVYNEIFINAGKEVAYNIFDQNRAYAAIGYHLGKLGKVEVGYLYQVVQQRRLIVTSVPQKMIMENNHTLQVALISDLPFYKNSE